MNKVTLIQYTNDNGKKLYIVNYNEKYGVLANLSEQEEDRIKSAFNMVLEMCAGEMGEVEK